jgi:hypothetical protein
LGRQTAAAQVREEADRGSGLAGWRVMNTVSSVYNVYIVATHNDRERDTKSFSAACETLGPSPLHDCKSGIRLTTFPSFRA